MSNDANPERKATMDELFVDREGRARVWPVFSVYLAAFVAIVAVSGVAASLVASIYPDVAPEEVLRDLPGLVAGGVASAAGLLLTLFFATRSFDLAGLRLLPGRERGRDLVVMVVGVLALGQVLDSLTVLSGLHRAGAMVAIRRALSGAAGEELFLAVIVFGLLSGTAEEIFFRGFMQTRLRARWSPAVAVAVTSACFALMHLEWLLAVLVFVLALYLGFITELSGSALPAIACHVVNNAVFTVITATAGSAESVAANAVLLGLAAPAFVASVLWLRRSLPTLPGR
jgi:membrane protease YdiL (CAAX protease family)